MYLHEDTELFNEVITNTAETLHLDAAIIEKDYFVTMILRLLSQRVPEAVFKGGTSLSKCYGVIDRFSEDIDIAVVERFGDSRRRALKQSIKAISDELGMPISNIDETQSRRDYNKYIFSYTPLEGFVAQSMTQGVMLETSLAAKSFPIEAQQVDSYVRRYLLLENSDIVSEYSLDLFEMPIQGLNRTLIDKVFALCDYYLQGKVARHSRHLYDIYKLLPLVPQDESFCALVVEVRAVRAEMSICPSAKPEMDIPELLRMMIAEDAYKEDYQEITTYFLNEGITYEMAAETLCGIADSGVFK